MTNGEFCSEVRNHLRLLNKDDRLSARYILSTAYTFVDYIINARPLSTIMRDLSVFKTAECVPMERVDYVTCHCPCVEFRTCDKLMKSKKKVPKMFVNSLGFIIESVSNIDVSEIYLPLRNPSDYTKSKKRQFGNKFKYYYIHDDYLYLLNTTAEIVTMNAMFVDEQEVDCFSDCQECDDCRSKLELKFICPKEHLSTVRDQVLQTIGGINKSIVEDENPNLDGNSKTIQ
jgi:hypothetical protein